MFDPLNLIGFIFVLGVLIFIHESGHYMVAKALGIKVEVFSLGFGPKILKFVRGGTEYCISALPLGGYVKMLGENPDEDLRGSREEFLSRSKFERFLVLVMGATLNIVLAIVLTAGIFMHGVPEPVYLSGPALIGSLDPDMAAARAGLRPEDEIVRIGDAPVATWRDLHLHVALNPDRVVDFEVRRDGGTLTIPVHVGVTEREKIGIIGVGPLTPITVVRVDEGGPAAKAGLQEGDLLMGFEGEPLFGPDGDLSDRLARIEAGGTISLGIERNGEARTVSLTAESIEGKPGLGMGLGFQTTIRRYGIVDAVAESVRTSWQQAGVLFVTLKKLVAGQLSPRTLSGPIEIYRLTGESLRSGWLSFVSLMALISLQLGIINLLPIPILDGGHIFILTVEGIMRRDLSLRIKERVMQFGFILLLIIMGGVIYLDVVKNL